MRPQRVPCVRDRTNEVWRSLLAIAEFAGPEADVRARKTVVDLYGGETDDPSPRLAAARRHLCGLPSD
jgi:hypothetical protein